MKDHTSSRGRSVRAAGVLALVMTAFFLVSAAGFAAAADTPQVTDSRKLQNGSFEDVSSWTDGKAYEQLDQGYVDNWKTTATDNKIELFKENGQYITGVTLKPSDGDIAAELNAEEESTLYQNVTTEPSSIYKWGLDHGARNGTDTMALVIGPAQTVDPAKPEKYGRDQLMQMIDWLIAENKTSIKTAEEEGLGEQLVVYSKKFGAAGTFQDNEDDNAFSLTLSDVYTEEWHIWIIADCKSASGSNKWGKYGSNAEAAEGGTDSTVDLSKYYFYTVPTDQTNTLFGFVSVGCDQPSISDVLKQKTYGNFLDNINFEIYHPLSGSTTLHGSGVVGGSGGTASSSGGLSSGYEVTVNKELITYAVDGVPLKVQAVVQREDAEKGCEFVGLYYTRQGENGALVTKYLQLTAGNQIPDDGLVHNDVWLSSTTPEGDIVYTYYLDNITSATDLHFVFIKSPTVTYDPNGGMTYYADRTYNTGEAVNVYSFKPVQNENGQGFTFIPPYTSKAAVGQNNGWKFMGWLLTGDTAQTGTGSILLPAEHTIACDYTVGMTREQYFKIWDGKISAAGSTDNITNAQWNASETLSYANYHKGLTMVAQWRWRQAFQPAIKGENGYYDSDSGGTVEISVSEADPNYVGEYTAGGGKAYFAATDEIVTVTAAAKEGYEFEGWYDERGRLLTTKKTYTFTETKESVSTYYARFSGEVTQNYIRQAYNGYTWEDITDDRIGSLDLYSDTGLAGRPISSAAVPGNGYIFVGWYKANGERVPDDMLSPDGRTLSYTISGNATYYARFDKYVPPAETTAEETTAEETKSSTFSETTFSETVTTSLPYSDPIVTVIPSVYDPHFNGAPAETTGGVTGEDVSAGAGMDADEDVTGSIAARVLIPTGLFPAASLIGLAVHSRMIRRKK